MTLADYQSLAPAFYVLPNDGEKYRCSECEELKSHNELIKPFTPDGQTHFATCLDCIDKAWLENATKVEPPKD